MSVQDVPAQLDEEDAFHYIVRYLREGRSGPYSGYGYGCYLPNVMREYLASVAGVHSTETDRYLSRVSPPFYNAAWELCRRGILRPGITAHGRQATDDGGSGNGYSLTAYGEKWLQQAGCMITFRSNQADLRASSTIWVGNSVWASASAARKRCVATTHKPTLRVVQCAGQPQSRSFSRLLSRSLGMRRRFSRTTARRAAGGASKIS